MTIKHYQVYFNLQAAKEPLSREEALQKTVFELCTEGDLETVQTALKSFKSSKLPTDLVGSSPLHYAAKKNKLDIAKILIESNRCSLENKMKKTPLHLAAQEGYVDMCKLLIKHQIDVNAQDILETEILRHGKKK
ncbi:GA-binding protein subunit beta-2-like [Diaphorina citri]|uniref:GA-binding protein subunit beta-2-like n=1 Tax=Diaphorina citri TaxID=121845 RepID=A0A3Q0IVM4_DIACI|nr:GA-binding protein subunit beta-2-like [Diaphorina citri]